MSRTNQATKAAATAGNETKKGRQQNSWPVARAMAGPQHRNYISSAQSVPHTPAQNAPSGAQHPPCDAQHCTTHERLCMLLCQLTTRLQHTCPMHRQGLQSTTTAISARQIPRYTLLRTAHNCQTRQRNGVRAAYPKSIATQLPTMHKPALACAPHMHSQTTPYQSGSTVVATKGYLKNPRTRRCPDITP